MNPNSNNRLNPSAPPRPKVTPRGLRRPDAADYIGMSPTKFDDLVSRGIMPDPKRIDGIVIWDRYGLDAAFEALGQEVTEDSIWNNVKA